MGTLADFFVASPSDAEAYEEAVAAGTVPASKYSRIQLGGLNSLHISMLWAILADEEWGYDRHELITVYSESKRWLYRFPDALSHLLASLDETQLEAASVAWARTEEMSCEPSDAQYVLENLSELAPRADNTGKGLYLWGSL